MPGGAVRDAIKLLSPQFLQGTVGEELLYVFGYACDVLLDKHNQGQRAHIPTYGDASALGQIGKDDGIPQGPTEPPTAYAKRLQRAYDDWQHAGSSRAILRQLLGFLSPATPPIRIVGNGNGTNGTPWDAYLAGDTTSNPPAHYLIKPNNWNWDGNATAWWRTWVILDSSSGSPFTCPKWGSARSWGNAGSWGGSGTSQQATGIQSIIALWKPANVSVVNVIVTYDGTLFDPAQPAGSTKLPDGQWAGWYELVGGTAVPSRNVNAAYLSGVT